MKINKLRLVNFKSFSDCEINLLPGINLLIGVNGSGKTTILEGLLVAMGGFFTSQERMAPQMLRQIEDRQIRIVNKKPIGTTWVYANSGTLEWSKHKVFDERVKDSKNIAQIKEFGSEVHEWFKSPDNANIAPLLVYYSTQRLFVEAGKTKIQVYDEKLGRKNGYLICLLDKGIRSELVNWLAKAVTDRATRQIEGSKTIDIVLENVNDALRYALQFFLDLPKEFNIKIIPDAYDEYNVNIEIGDGPILPIENYSNGFRNLLYLVIDMVWRASQLNPWLTFPELKVQTTGIVLIDEIDLHLHPKWQGKALPFLANLFPNVQFVVTTHSPTVISNFKHRETEDEQPIDGLLLVDAAHICIGKTL